MDTVGHVGMASVFHRRIALAAVGVALCLLAVPAQATVMIVDIGWGYFGGSDMDNASLTQNYALQEGSIVQIIAYDSSAYPSTAFQFPAGNANNNFDLVGTYVGSGIPGEPNVDPWDEAPLENNIYNPNSAPIGHVIAYTTTIGPAIGDNANGYDWYNIYASFQILDNYDSIYIRVFGATDFPADGIVHASYWGISDVQSGGGGIGTWYVTYNDVTAADHVNYFEVIPEPGSLSLFALGGVGLWAARRRRPKRD